MAKINSSDEKNTPWYPLRGSAFYEFMAAAEVKNKRHLF